MLDSVVIAGLFAAFCLIGYIIGQLKARENSQPIIIHTENKTVESAKPTRSNAPRSRKTTKNTVNKKRTYTEDDVVEKISIDDRIMVTGVGTDGLEKKYDNLAKTTQSSESTASSVNKLKDLKG